MENRKSTIDNRQSSFVILHHKTDRGDHWDMLFEYGEVLLAWQLSREPFDLAASGPIPARRLADHRKIYLTYEGPISRGRGHVRRVDEGDVKFEKFTDNECVVLLQGTRLRGVYSLAQGGSGEEWVFDRVGPQ